MATIVLDEGLYPADVLPEEEYHADPVPSGSLSQSGARYLLPPYTPAHFDHYRRNPHAASRAQELGTAAHVRMLGSGIQVEVCPDPDVTDYNRKDPQEWRKKVRAAGHVPLLQHEADAVQEMEAVVRAHPDASALLTPGSGITETSMFWIDEQTGVWRRGRADFLQGLTVRRDANGGAHIEVIDGRVRVVDYKTKGKPAHPALFAKDVWEYGYYIQGPWYADGVQAVCDLDETPEFWWVVQETSAPYLVNTFYLDPDDEEWGRRCARAALRRYAECAASGVWPAHTRSQWPIEIPRYGHYQLRDWERDGVFDGDRPDMDPGGKPVLYDDTYRGWNLTNE